MELSSCTIDSFHDIPRDIITRMEEIYCNKMGLEFTFMTEAEQVSWIKQRFETPGALQMTRDERLLILERLARASGFEDFLKKKYPSEKRFGLEGCDMLIPALKQLIDVTSARGVETIVIGMAHRGRLNVLSNVCRKPLHTLLTQFSGLEATDAVSMGATVDSILYANRHDGEVTIYVCFIIAINY